MQTTITILQICKQNKMDICKRVIKNKKKKYNTMSNLLDKKIYDGKMSNCKSTSEKSIQKNESSSFVTKKVKKKKKNIPTIETYDKFSNTNSKFSKRPKHLTSQNSSLLSKKKLVKNIGKKGNFPSENIASDSKKKKFIKKRQKSLSPENQNFDKIQKFKRNKYLKQSQKFNNTQIHAKPKNINIQIVHENKEEENASILSDDISEESEVSSDEFNQYKDNNDDDTDEDLEIRNEIKNLNVYKEIKKLCQGNPMLLSNFSVKSENDLAKMEETVQFSSSDTNTSNKAKNLSKTSKECSNSLPNTSNSINKHVKKLQVHNVQTNQQENMLQRDYPNKSEKRNCSSNLRNKAQEKLQAAKFRFLNEKLYTESGKDSFTYFQKNNDEFLDYHSGYSLQVLKWPMNPVNKIISFLQKLDKKLVIADMGCGDAKIAQTLTHCVVHSFDLVALNEHVTPCNISKVPLSSDTVDVVVFCLSLMGTNLKEYLLEAFRILKYGGVLKIAEVESRIPSLDKFIKSIESLGFVLENKDIQHKLFVFLDFKKDKKRKKMQDVVLNPCVYKKR